MISTPLQHAMSRRIGLCAVVSLCLILLVVARSSSPLTDDSMPALESEKAVAYLKASGLYSSLQDAVHSVSYRIETADQTPPGVVAYRATNPSQRYSAAFIGEGIEIASNKEEGESWRLGFKLTGLGYGDRMIKPQVGSTSVAGDRITIIRPISTDNHRTSLAEWYINRPDGLEQGFTLESAPGERRDGERLTLILSVEGDLTAQLTDNDQAVHLIAANGEPALRYDHLRAYDSAHRALNARMKVRSGQVLLEVDDGNAAYPVIVDPTFSQVQKLAAPDGTDDDFFGTDVAIDGDTAIVGASPVDAVYVFVRNGGQWQLQQKVHVDSLGGFGSALAINNDTFVAGAFGEESQTGAAYVYTRAGAVWTQQQRLTASDRTQGDLFGIAVDLSGDTAVICARFHAAGLRPEQGSAYVFVRAGGLWSEQQHLTAPASETAEFYADSVAISGDTIVVGSASALVPANCSAYVYTRSGGVWSQQERLPPGGSASGLFGSSVDIEGDIAVVGALFSNSAHVFERSGGVWGSGQALSGTGSGEFGISVSINDGTIVVGARNERVGGSFGRGAAFVFRKELGQWSQQQMLTASDGAANDRFGNSVGNSGDTIIIGAPFDQVGDNDNQGSAYIFGPNAPPAITAATVTVQQGRTLTAASIASVSDSETPASELTTSVVPGGTASGVALSNIVNAGGAITANVSASCTATSGTVRLSVADLGGLSTTADLQVSVTPNDAPVINCPANIVKPTDPALCSAIVTFTVTANDDCDGVLMPVCNPPSGSTFTKGTTTVTCTVSDSSGHASSCSFTVTVNDTEHPKISCPASMTVIAARPGDPVVIVNYPAPAASDNCGLQSVVCTPPSGGAFPLGATTVSCTATDTSGNTSACSFAVTVFDICLQDDTNPNTTMVWNSLTGDYRFCCGGSTFVGRGLVSRKGSVFTLASSPADRRLAATVDSTQNKGTASLQAPPGTTRCAISDRDIRNNTNVCGASGP